MSKSEEKVKDEEKVNLIVTEEIYKDKELNKEVKRGYKFSTTKERAEYLVKVKGFCKYDTDSVKVESNTK